MRRGAAAGRRAPGAARCGDGAGSVRAREKSAVLITSDKDFGEPVFRQGRMTGGVVLLQLGGLSAAAKASSVSEAVSEYAREMQGAFAVISPGVVRIRPRRGRQ